MTQNKNTRRSQEPISTEELKVYFDYLITGQVKDEKHAKDINRLARRTTTVSDVTLLFKVMTAHQSNTITQLMDAIQIQNRILQKLGATDEMFDAAQEDYNQVIAEAQKELMAKAEELAPKEEEK